jgi:hypothetical protein
MQLNSTSTESGWTAGNSPRPMPHTMFNPTHHDRSSDATTGLQFENRALYIGSHTSPFKLIGNSGQVPLGQIRHFKQA